MVKTVVFIGLLVIGGISVTAQVNLVPNPSFEDITLCPNNTSQINYALPWNGPSADVFNGCDDDTMAVPANIFGWQKAHDGLGYGGFWTATYGNTSGEFLQIQLLNTLEAGKRYELNFYASFADSSNYSSEVQAFLGDSVYYADSLTDEPNSLSFTLGSDRFTWVSLTGVFTALGTENYLIFGNIIDTGSYIGGGGAGTVYPGSYYYFDDISLTCIDCPVTPTPELFIPSLVHGDQFFEISNLPEGSLLLLYNSMGQRVFENENYNNRLAALDFRTGIYYYSLILSDGTSYKGKLCILN
jgi:hypothetical protein